MKKSLHVLRFWLALFSLSVIFLGYSPTLFAQSYTFTNCTATGINGPTQAQVTAAYALTNLAGQVTATGGIQTWTVPATGPYKIEVYGANGYGPFAGRGAYMSGEFVLTAASTLKILVGQQGGCCVASGTNQYGGGGGSFVVTSTNTPLIIAGGGGGANGVTSIPANADASITTSGNAGSGTSTSGAGGTNGNGGVGGSNAGAGGGLLTDGTVASATASGKAFVNGGVGGTSATSGGFGGFGGGGGADSWDNRRGGGGGGYSGGGGGGSSTTGAEVGGGGGSFNSGINQVNTPGLGTGHGLVIITALATIPCAGKPNPGKIFPAGPLTSVCAGTPFALTDTGFSFLQNLSFQWEVSVSPGLWAPIAGATSLTYIAAPTVSSEYRMIVTCTNTGDTAITNVVAINVPPPTYGTIPYFQDFETWVNKCATTDVPSGGIWANIPSTGNESWRRPNQGASAGWANVTGGQYTPTSWPNTGTPTPTGSARFHSSNSTVGSPGNLDLFLDCQGSFGDKQLYFYYMNQLTAAATGADSLHVMISFNGGGSFITLASYDTAQTWRRRSIPIQSNSLNTIIRFQGKRILSANTTDIGIDSVLIVGPCSGSPAAGTIVAPATVCAGSFTNLTTVGTTLAGGLTYQWEQSLNGTSGWTPALGGSGANTQFFTTPSLYDTIYYRMVVGCGASTATTPSVRVDVKSPFYASVPYIQNFENWVTSCAATDLPDSTWANSLASGNTSWRKSSQGSSGGWTNQTQGQYNTQASVSGSFSARFHSSNAPAGGTGQLDVLLNCSQQTGNKQLEFHYRNDNGADSLEVSYSTDGGFTFTPLDTFYTVTQWTEYRMPLVSNSATTIVRFKGYGDYSTTAGSDIYIDSVRIVEPCSSPVSAGTINNLVSACKNVPFLLYLLGNTQAAGLSYDWQSSPDNATWTSIGASYNLTTTITQPTFFRAVVHCVASNLRDTTPVQFVDTTQFYYCYCGNGATTTTGADVGNVLLQSLPGSVNKINNGTFTTVTNNATANKTYTDFRYSLQPPAQLYWDTTYRIAVTQINSGAYTNAQVTVWIDIDHSGTFDPSEIMLQKPTSASSFPAQMVDGTFILPNTMDTGITGMRVQVEEGSAPSSNPCGTYTGGETEDYLVRIFFPPCDGPPNAGTAIISDSSTCIGYTIFITDTTYDKTHSNLMRVWQQSPDGFSWANIAGSDTLDQVAHVVTAKTYFRMRLICATPVKLDTSYSNIVMVDINPPVSCYCLSYADGGVKDTSDVGAFYFETFSNNVLGPHLKNPEAWRLRTDYTRQTPPDLWVDSTYDFSLYHIMRSETHADAKVTIFVDYDADLLYEAPQELVYTGYTTASNYNITGSFKIPHNALPDLPTGMRVILNNDVGANLPSDEGCGVYTSGETEDYVVVLRSPLTNVNTVRSIGHYSLFPNPTEGRFTVSFTLLRGVEGALIRVTNVVGAEVVRKEVGAIGGGVTYQEQLDLTKMARGVYMVELKAGEERIIRKLVVQ